MKETHDIIESGILERYLLGELSKDELATLENEIEKDMNLKLTYQQLELDIEKMAIENAVTPTGNVKQALFRQLKGDTDKKIIKIPAPKTLQDIYGNCG